MSAGLKDLYTDPLRFSSVLGGVTLRSYQSAVAEAVIDSVIHQRGRSFVVMFPRQSGKNELQAQIEAYLLALYHKHGGEMIKVSPTWRPQSQNAMRRLERVLRDNLHYRAHGFHKEDGRTFRVGRARLTFLSGAPGASIVGATASLLLEVDEAQDVSIEKYDKEIAPMAASTNATRVFWGTAWTAHTLLARELRAARAAETAEQAAGLPPFTPRAYVIDAGRVAGEVPAYGLFVRDQVARLGRDHPLVRTQFFSEEIDGQGGLFPPERLARMRGGQPVSAEPAPGKVYALLLDVAGEAPAGEAQDAAVTGDAARDAVTRDATALTVVEVDRRTIADPLLRAPTYRPVLRRVWVGAGHTELYGQVRALAERYRARWVVVDATGVGAGLASFLARALPGRVTPFLFNAASKSKLGWDFTALVDQGRWQEGGAGGGLDELFFQQAAACRFEILPGPNHLLRWGVPDGTRDPLTGRPVHDDLLISAALSALLDGLEYPARGSSGFGLLPGKDPLDEMQGF